VSGGLLRITLLGVAVGGTGFTALGVYLNSAIGVGFFANPGPLAMLAVVGATVGGLAAPLLHGRKRDEGSGSAGGAGAARRTRSGGATEEEE